MQEEDYKLFPSLEHIGLNNNDIDNFPDNPKITPEKCDNKRKSEIPKSKTKSSKKIKRPDKNCSSDSDKDFIETQYSSLEEEENKVEINPDLVKSVNFKIKNLKQKIIQEETEKRQKQLNDKLESIKLLIYNFEQSQ